MTEWIKNTGTKPNTQGKPFEVRLRNWEIIKSSEEGFVNFRRGFDWSLEEVELYGDIIEWRFINSSESKNLTQADVQSLLNVVREELRTVTRIKEFRKQRATNSWNMCSKDNPNTQSFFELHSFTRKKALEAKQKERKLVNLITKLKGMR